MFQNVNEAIQWVTGRKKSCFPFSDFAQFMQSQGNPQYQLKCIHVAGTNGKGSTTNYIRSILQSAGYKVGSFTSPHLITHLDRIRVNDENIDGQYFLDIVNQYQEVFEKYQLSMFQIDMFISVRYFIDQKVDFVVYEVGLGGRLDATNIISPLVAVITNIEMDHMQILGDSIEKIAKEKGGIIKENLPVITFEKKPEALNVFAQIAQEKHARIIQTGKAKNISSSLQIQYDYKDYHVTLNTTAPYQILNSSAAIECIDLLKQKGIIQCSEQQLYEGLNTNWAGRFEQVWENPKVIIDGAHNENGIDGLCECLDHLNEQYIIIFSALSDKEYHKMLGKLMDKGEVIVTQFENSRMGGAAQLAAGYDCEVILDYQQAIETALQKNKTVIITGSLYFVSVVREYFLNK